MLQTKDVRLPRKLAKNVQIVDPLGWLLVIAHFNLFFPYVQKLILLVTN